MRSRGLLVFFDFFVFKFFAGLARIFLVCGWARVLASRRFALFPMYSLFEFLVPAVELETIQGQFDCQRCIRSLSKIVAIIDGRLYKNQLVGVIGVQDIFSSYWDFKAGWNHQSRLHRKTISFGI